MCRNFSPKNPNCIGSRETSLKRCKGPFFGNKRTVFVAHFIFFAKKFSFKIWIGVLKVLLGSSDLSLTVRSFCGCFRNYFITFLFQEHLKAVEMVQAGLHRYISVGYFFRCNYQRFVSEKEMLISFCAVL